MGHSGHSIDDTSLFVLSEGARPGVPHFEETGRAVAPHAGQDHADRIAPGQFGDRIEQDVDRRAMPVDRLPVNQPAARRRGIGDLQVPVAAGGQIDLADFEAGAVGRLLDGRRAEAVQPFRKALRKRCAACAG